MIRSLLHFGCSTLLLVLSIPAISLAQKKADTSNNTYVSPNGTVFTYIEQMPRFSGDLNHWLGNHIRYPQAAIDSNLEGRAVVKFVIDETGDVSHVEIAKSSGYGILDREAIRVVREMPEWHPGTNNGVAVKVYYQLPITFKLTEPDPKPNSKNTVAKEIMPKFNGDIAAYISANLVYPKIARRKGWEGRAMVKFIISETGSIEQVEVTKSSGHQLLDDEAVRMVTNMPHWQPGVNNGTPVKVYFTLPITFKLQD